MNLLILGATGPTGRHVVDLALEGGDTVTALARSPQALEDLASVRRSWSRRSAGAPPYAPTTCSPAPPRP